MRSTTPTDSPPAVPQKVTNCQRVRANARRIRTLAIRHRPTPSPGCFSLRFRAVHGHGSIFTTHLLQEEPTLNREQQTSVANRTQGDYGKSASVTIIGAWSDGFSNALGPLSISHATRRAASSGDSKK